MYHLVKGIFSLFFFQPNPYVFFGNGQRGTMFTITTFDYESGKNSHTVNINVTSNGVSKIILKYYFKLFHIK